MTFKEVWDKVQARPLHYVLNEDHSIRPATLMEWAENFNNIAHRRVAQDFIDTIHVSTVFLGLDHGFLPDGPPIVFETMIFGGEHDEDQWRYSTWDEAVKGHEYAVALARGHEEHGWHDDEALS